MTFYEIARAVRLHRVVALVTALVIFGIALAAALLPANTYTATAAGSVQAPQAVNRFDFLNTSKYIMPLVQSSLTYPAIVAPAQAQLTHDQQAKVGEATVSTTNDPGSTILSISVTSPDPQLSSDYANALAKSLAAYHAESVWQFLDSAPATPPLAPTGPNRKLIIIGGFVLALIGGLFAALIAAAFERRRLLPEEIRARVGLAVLGGLPRMRGKNWTVDDLDATTDPYLLECLQRLRINLEISSQNGALPRTICITSLHQGAGKSRVCALIAWTFGTAGYQVTVIDADLRMPAQHRLFNLPVTPGLSDALRPSGTQVFFPHNTIQSLSIVPAGSPTSQPIQIVDTALPVVLAEAVQRSALVLIDTPPVILMAETTRIAAASEAVVLVVDAPRLRIEELERVVADMRRSGSVLAGVVLNRVSRRSASASRYRAYKKHRR